MRFRRATSFNSRARDIHTLPMLLGNCTVPWRWYVQRSAIMTHNLIQSHRTDSMGWAIFAMVWNCRRDGVYSNLAILASTCDAVPPDTISSIVLDDKSARHPKLGLCTRTELAFCSECWHHSPHTGVVILHERERQEEENSKKINIAARTVSNHYISCDSGVRLNRLLNWNAVTSLYPSFRRFVSIHFGHFLASVSLSQWSQMANATEIERIINGDAFHHGISIQNLNRIAG